MTDINLTYSGLSTTDQKISVITPLSAASVIPDNYQSELIAWRDHFTMGYFRIGDIANEIYEGHKSCKTPGITYDMVCWSVGKFCGRSARTVRYYADIAGFFPQSVRLYYDVLPFCHFATAMRYKDRWKEVLEIASESPAMTQDDLESVCRETFYINRCNYADVGLPAARVALDQNKPSANTVYVQQPVSSVLKYRLGDVPSVLEQAADELDITDQDRSILRECADKIRLVSRSVKS